MHLGIDFGTCYSSASLCINGDLKPVKAPLTRGYSFPSSVFVTQSGEILVGQVAENKRRGAPQGYRAEIKRNLKQPDPFIFWQQYEYSVETLVSAQIERMKAEAEK
jgi:molecular chaperone DnaK (HSP70)